jgi:hypothetical protein
MVPDRERDLLPVVVELRLGGLETLNGLARELNARGIKTGEGCNWYPSTVERLFDASDELVRQARLRSVRPHILGRRCARRGFRVTAAATLAVMQAADQRASGLLPLIVEMRCSGETSLRKAAAKLNRSGLAAPRGGQCCAMTVKRALARRMRSDPGRLGHPVTPREQKAVRRAQSIKFDRCLERRLCQLLDRGYQNTTALSAELNRLGWLSKWGLAWTVNSLGQYVSQHLPAIWQLFRARDLDGALWREVRALFVKAEQLGIRSRPAMTEFFNDRRQRSLSGRHRWNEHLIQYARKRLGLTESEATRVARRVQAKRIHDGIARREGIDREPFSAHTRAAKMAAKGAVTPMGLPMTEGALRRVLYRGRRRGRRDACFWSDERKAEFEALVEAGRSVHEIVWDLGVSESAVRSRLWKRRKRGTR